MCGFDPGFGLLFSLEGVDALEGAFGVEEEGGGVTGGPVAEVEEEEEVDGEEGEEGEVVGGWAEEGAH